MTTTENTTHNFSEVATVLDFMLAGNATITLESQASGNWFTYKVVEAKKMPGSFFVNLLSGPDNENDFVYMGMLRPVQGHPEWLKLSLTRASRITAEAPSFKAFDYAMENLMVHNRIPAKLVIRHEGRCGRCGRKLTVPESIDSGIGPECRKHM